jgi:3-hydroxyisobutyrate dehydrogenase
LENEDTEDYWDNLMKNREPLKLPYWAEEDGMQVIKNDEKRKIGWIGLGKTGHQLAYLLVRAGYDVTVFDKNRSKGEDLVKYGAKFAQDANSVAAESDYLFLCVGFIKNLVNLMENSEYGIYDDIKTGSIVVNHSPRDPDFEHDEKIFLKARHCTLLDAPIHMGDGNNHEMKQELQVGGVESEFEHVQELLKLYATKLRYIGDQEVCANDDFPCEV